VATCGFSENVNNSVANSPTTSPTPYLTPEPLDSLQRVGAKVFHNNGDGNVMFLGLPAEHHLNSY
jgi:hypothetical protein